ncbi:MAG: proline-rich domain-containing protein [Dermatophilaceae bacterium]
MTESPYPPPDGQPQYGQPYDGQTQYGPPQPGGSWAPPPLTRPPAMDRAVLLMKVGAVVSALSALSALVMGGEVRDMVVESSRSQPSDAQLTPAQIDTLVNVALGTALVAGLIGVGLWILMAVMNGKGKSWARVVATIFFVISVLSFVASLAQPQSLTSRLLSILTVAVGAGAIYYLYQRESTAFYEASSRR